MQFEKSFNEEAKWGNTMVEFGVRFEQIRIFESKAIPNTDTKNIIDFNNFNIQFLLTLHENHFSVLGI
jgi:hypothetical protein